MVANNPGGCLVVPVEHHENLYDIPPRLGTPILAATQQVALAPCRTYPRANGTHPERVSRSEPAIARCAEPSHNHEATPALTVPEVPIRGTP